MGFGWLVLSVRKIENRFFKIWSISRAPLILADLTVSSFSLLSVSQNGTGFKVSNSANRSLITSIKLFTEGLLKELLCSRDTPLANLSPQTAGLLFCEPAGLWFGNHFDIIQTSLVTVLAVQVMLTQETHCARSKGVSLNHNSPQLVCTLASSLQRCQPSRSPR